MVLNSDNFGCRCGAKYKLLEVIENIGSYYLLKVWHGNVPNKNDYETVIIYNLKTNSLLTDGQTGNPKNTREKLWDKIKKEEKNEIPKRRKNIKPQNYSNYESYKFGTKVFI